MPEKKQPKPAQAEEGQTTAEQVEAMAKRRGFFWPAAQIYNPIAGFWNYGPLGTAMKAKFVELWRKTWVKEEGAHELDTADMLPEIVWVASGHSQGFNDKQTICTGKDKHRWRADHLIEESGKVKEKLEGKTTDELAALIKEHNIRCPKDGSKLGDVFVFNLMFSIPVGALGENKAYLKPETTQSSVIDFPFVYRSQRGKLPLKIAQIGKSFRNEISPRQVLIRMREFWMAELQVFFNPKSTDWPDYNSVKDFQLRILPVDGRSKGEALTVPVSDALKKGWIPNQLIAFYLAKVQRFYESLGFPREHLRFKELTPEERAHYSKAHWDFEVKTDFGWVEAVNNAWRGDYDLSRHQQYSKQKLDVFEDNEHILPNLYEPSFGIDRTLFMLMLTTWHNDGKRTWLSLPPILAPYHVAVFPLVKKDGLDVKAEELAKTLRKRFDVIFDPSDSIGRRYARVDEVGVPFAVTFDYDSLKDGAVTVRNRDTTEQVRVKIAQLESWLAERLK